MGPVVIVELPAPQAASPHAGALIAACTAGLRTGECTLSSDEEAKGKAEAVAVVSFPDPDRPEAFIEVGARRSGQPVWTSRSISFHPEDAPVEQWRSVGFAIASLTGALGVTEPPPEPEPKPPEPAPPPPVAPPPPRPAHSSQLPSKQVPSFHAAARLELGPGLDRGPWRLGGAILGGYDLPGHVFSVWALAADSFRSSAVTDVDLTWTRFGLGAGASARLPAGFEGRAVVAGLVERVSASENSNGVTEARSRWLGGAELDVSLRWPRASSASALVGGNLVELSGGTSVVSHGTRLASSPATEGGVLVGLEIRW